LIPSFRKAARRYREDYALKRSDPAFGEALDAALEIDGFTSPVELNLLYHLALATETGAVVEVGSYLGRSTVVLASAAADRGRDPVVAVDPHEGVLGVANEERRDTEAEFLQNLDRAGVRSQVRLMRMTAAEAATEWEGDAVGLLFVDGLHTREAVLEDTRSWARFLTPDACIVFDDFLPYPGVRAAVRELRSGGLLRGSALIVGKMVALGPARVLRSVPAPPGARILPRLGDRPLDMAIRVLATQHADAEDERARRSRHHGP
jgi:predicted O-methyltransferase YrrM